MGKKRADNYPRGAIVNIEWIRERVSTALMNVCIIENGPLSAMEEQAILVTDRFKRNPIRYAGERKSRYRLPSHPLKIKQKHAKGKSKPLINEVTYRTSSWRRGIHQLPNEMRLWLLYCYGDYQYYREQILIVPYIWHEFQRLNSKKRITKKVKPRLQSLTLLAIQAVKAEINQTAKKYTDVKLAELLGVSADAWRKSYKLYWICLLDCCYQLDRDSLFKISALS